ncbi:IS1595 family transposase [Natrarchaeobius oligotrophus]|uniref:IS1595 family transposase n=1 Tax=Natrarchaeobius oligotrophus TaxID=3455743 RepID=UPI0037447554
MFAHSKVALRKWLFSIYAFLRFNTSLRQLQLEIDVQYKTIYQRVERFTKALRAVTRPFRAGRNRRGLRLCRAERPRARGSYDQDKPPVFTIVDRGTGDRYVIPAKSADESTIRLLLAVCEKEPLTVYTNRFRAYDPLAEDDAFDREYADEDVHVNTCESHGSLLRPWLSPHRGISKDKLTQYLRAFQLRRKLFRNQGEKRSNSCQSDGVKSTQCYTKRSRIVWCDWHDSCGQ